MPDGRAVRKLTTILAADVAGYSRLVSNAEEATIAAWKGHRSELIDPLIDRHQGRIANTAGDSIIAEFGSVVEAVRCALEIQSGLAERNRFVASDDQIKLRIGINLGDVVEDGRDLLGDGVNVAARLEGLADAGQICVSRSVRDQVRYILDVEYDDLGQVEVKNIDYPVRAFLLRGGDGSPSLRGKSSARWRSPLLLGSILVVLLLMAGSGFWYLIKPGNDLAEALPGNTISGSGPALAVLPFINLSANADDEYFSDGITEDLTTALARIPNLAVVARNTAFTYKGRQIDSRKLGRELGVRYVLEGSARKQADRLRLNVTLTDARTGNSVWSERFDRPIEDIFVVQDELVDRITGSVASRLRRREGERALEASSETLQAHDLTARARLLFRENTIESAQEARKLLRRAIDLDDRYSRAYSTLAQVEMFFFTNRVNQEYASTETAKRVVQAASRAAQLEPENASARAINGMAQRLVGDYDLASKEAEQALKLAPGDPDVLAQISPVLIGVGRYQETVDSVETAKSLDPYVNPLHVGVIQSQAYFALGQFVQAKESAEFCLKRTPDDVRCQESLTRALGELGPPEAARAAAEKLLEMSPGYTVSEYRRRASRNRKDADAIERWAQGLLKAGVPD